VRCAALEPLIEAIADGTMEPSADDLAHLSTCEVCRARLDSAQRLEQWLAAREMAQPPASFTGAVMARIGQERWRAERAIDIGFNLAIAAAVIIILVSAAGAAWSLGFLTITFDTDALVRAALAQVEGRVITELQSLLIAAVVLTMALVLWWWAEAATD
jgi:hypothetical protein